MTLKPLVTYQRNITYKIQRLEYPAHEIQIPECILESECDKVKKFEIILHGSRELNQ